MDRTKIIVPVDFTPASDMAVRFALLIAQKTAHSLMLVHLLSTDTPPSEKASAENRLAEMADKTTRESGITAQALCAGGTIFNDLPKLTNRHDHLMMVIGTHGIHGLKQKLFGADMLKVVRKIRIPVLIVQEGSNPAGPLNPIVLPIGGHRDFKNIVEATGAVAGWFGSAVHIYSVLKPGEEYSAKTRENILQAEQYFEQQHIPYQRVEEEVTLFSVGYARQTIQYARKISGGLISIMSVTTEEHFYFAQPDKESLINNEQGIPVLCTSDLVTC
jgi:nucleotide-binding universal stress UspA family protein